MLKTDENITASKRASSGTTPNMKNSSGSSSSTDKKNGKSTSFQRPSKKSNDTVFETKRDTYNTNIAALDADIAKLKSRAFDISQKITAATSQDTNREAKEKLRASISSLKGKREEIIHSKLPIQVKLTEAFDIHKKKVAELNISKEALPFKKVEDIDKKIMELDTQIESGRLKLIEEKRMVADISKLKKFRKGLEALSAQQASIDEIEKIIELYKQSLKEKDTEIKSIAEKLKQISAELSALDMDRNSHQLQLQGLFSESDKVKAEIDIHYKSKSALYKEFQLALEDHQKWIENENRKWEQQKIAKEIENVIYHLQKEMRSLELEPVSSDVEKCINLENYIRTYILKEEISLYQPPVITAKAASKFAPLELRKVEKNDDDVLMNNKLLRDASDNYYFRPTKPSKSNRKSPSTTTFVPQIQEMTPLTPITVPEWVSEGLKSLSAGTISVFGDANSVLSTLKTIKTDFEEKQTKLAESRKAKQQEVQARIDEQKKKLKESQSNFAVDSSIHPGKMPISV